MVTLVTGGIKSGKSHFALKLTEGYNNKLFIATLEVIDSETEEKVKRHKNERKFAFSTIEEPVQIVNVLKNNIIKYDIIVIDCINIWINNLIFYKINITEYVDRFIDFLTMNNNTTNIIIVTNEVGQSIIPIDTDSRNFINFLGITNQKLASVADNVYLLAVGIPIRIKG
jgi:adenosylcobinamide kinase/adenosylcobinamide-phosphate guanylyltransferase